MNSNIITAINIIRKEISTKKLTSKYYSKLKKISDDLADKFILLLEGDRFLHLLDETEIIKIYDIISSTTTKKIASLESIFSHESIEKTNKKYDEYSFWGILNKLEKAGVKRNKNEKAQYILEEFISKQSKRAWADIINKFGQFARYEEEYGRSIHLMNINQISSILAEKGSNSADTIKSVIVKYLTWLSSQGIISEDDVITIREIDNSSLDYSEFMTTNYFANIDEVLDIISKNTENPFLNTYYYYPLVILSWIGFDMDDIVSAKCDDIDFDNKTIQLSRLSIDIPIDRFLRYFEYTKDSLLDDPIIDPYKIDSDSSNVTAFIFRILKDFNENSNEKEIKLKYVYESGCFDRIFNIELKEKRDVFRYSDERLSRIFFKTTISKNRYRRTYKNWKRVFKS